MRALAELLGVVDLLGRWLMPQRSLSPAALVAVVALWGLAGCGLAALLRSCAAKPQPRKD